MRIVMIALTSFFLLASAPAIGAPGDAGYDPEADPFVDLETAKEQASRAGKRILLEVGGEWCGWCHRLERFLHDYDDVRVAMLDRFVVVKVNWSPENENAAFLSSYPEIAGYPHMFVLEADGTLVHSQGTGELEAGSSYDPDRFLRFVRAWGPPGKR